MPDAIIRFDGAYRFLSNFYVTPIYDVLIDTTYKSVEHAYQASKTWDAEWRKQIIDADTPGEAKRLGQLAPLRIDWTDDKRKDVMRLYLRMKFRAWLERDTLTYCFDKLAHALMDTFPMDLIEGNNWHDTYFGVCYGSRKCDCVSNGQNWLGRLLVERREQLMKYRDNVA